jgi:hypothetical protein
MDQPGQGVPSPSGPATPEAFFAAHPLGIATLRRVRDALTGIDGVAVRVSKSQVVFRRRRGFAYLWLPGQYLAKPAAEVVLSIALGREDRSPRWKEVAHPAAAHWMHHLEIGSIDDLDDEVGRLVREAAERAG